MLNPALLKHVVRTDEKTIAQCPACAAAGGDNKGEHLVIWPDGKFGCVAYPQDKEHTKAIFKLVGVSGRIQPPPVTINRQVIPESQVLLSFGRSGRQKPTSSGGVQPEQPPEPTPVPLPSPEPTAESQKTVSLDDKPRHQPWNDPGRDALEAAREFLDHKT